MMSKILYLLLISSIVGFGGMRYNGSSTAAVTIAGGIIKTQTIVIDKKYKRKDCPICLGKGYYISGDKITKVNCGYCEPDTKDSQNPSNQSPKEVIHPPIHILPNCTTGTCPSHRK